VLVRGHWPGADPVPSTGDVAGPRPGGLDFRDRRIPAGDGNGRQAARWPGETGFRGFSGDGRCRVSAVLKTARALTRPRGFKSHALRFRVPSIADHVKDLHCHHQRRPREPIEPSDHPYMQQIRRDHGSRGETTETADPASIGEMAGPRGTACARPACRARGGRAGHDTCQARANHRTITPAIERCRRFLQISQIPLCQVGQGSITPPLRVCRLRAGRHAGRRRMLSYGARSPRSRQGRHGGGCSGHRRRRRPDGADAKAMTATAVAPGRSVQSHARFPSAQPDTKQARPRACRPLPAFVSRTLRVRRGITSPKRISQPEHELLTWNGKPAALWAAPAGWHQPASARGAMMAAAARTAAS
jgi:hypothetical protein